MKFLAMQITNQKRSFDIYGNTFTKYVHGTWSLLNIVMIFGIKVKSIIFTHTMYVPQRLNTGFVLQGHK